MSTPAGFCFYHRIKLRFKEMVRRQCIRRNCRHLKKYTNHPVWNSAEYRKEKENVPPKS